MNMFFTSGSGVNVHTQMDNIIKKLLDDERKLWNFLNAGDKNSIFIGLKGMHKMILSLTDELKEIEKIEHKFLDISKNELAKQLEEELTTIRTLLGNQIENLVKIDNKSDEEIMAILNGNKIDPHISETSTRLQTLCTRFLSDEEELKLAA